MDDLRFWWRNLVVVICVVVVVIGSDCVWLKKKVIMWLDGGGVVVWSWWWCCYMWGWRKKACMVLVWLWIMVYEWKWWRFCSGLMVGCLFLFMWEDDDVSLCMMLKGWWFNGNGYVVRKIELKIGVVVVWWRWLLWKKWGGRSHCYVWFFLSFLAYFFWVSFDRCQTYAFVVLGI